MPHLKKLYFTAAFLGVFFAQINILQASALDFTPPVEAFSPGRILDGFGLRVLSNGDGVRYDFHRGIDIEGERGDPILASAEGLIIKAGAYENYPNSGNMVEIWHAACKDIYNIIPDVWQNPCVTSYLHLDSIGVEVGQMVEQGQEIGTMGDSGANAVHLHFSLSLVPLANKQATPSLEYQLSHLEEGEEAQTSWFDPEVDPLGYILDEALGEQNLTVTEEEGEAVLMISGPAGTAKIEWGLLSPSGKIVKHRLLNELRSNNGGFGFDASTTGALDKNEVLSIVGKTYAPLANKAIDVEIFPENLTEAGEPLLAKYVFKGISLERLKWVRVTDVWGNIYEEILD